MYFSKPKPKQQNRRYNLIPVFIGLLLLLAAILLFDRYRASSILSELNNNGVAITAEVSSVQLIGHRMYRSFRWPTVDDAAKAEAMDITVNYQVNGIDYHEKMKMSFTLAKHDHLAVYNQARTARLAVTYSRANPALVRPTLELTDPQNNSILNRYR